MTVRTADLAAPPLRARMGEPGMSGSSAGGFICDHLCLNTSLTASSIAERRGDDELAAFHELAGK